MCKIAGRLRTAFLGDGSGGFLDGLECRLHAILYRTTPVWDFEDDCAGFSAVTFGREKKSIYM